MASEKAVSIWRRCSSRSLLGSLLEENLRQGLILGFGSPVLFVTSPISLAFLVIAALTLVLPLMRQLRWRRSGNVA